MQDLILDSPEFTEPEIPSIALQLRNIQNHLKKEEAQNLKFIHWLRSTKPADLELRAKAISDSVATQIDCTQCGNCCRAYEVTVRSKDIPRLATHLDLQTNEFVRAYLKKDNQGEFIFKQKPCPFLKKNSCTVYDARPTVCRSYPHFGKAGLLNELWRWLGDAGNCPIVYHTFEKLKAHYSEQRS